MIMSPSFEMIYDKEIDARGSFCPGPLLELIRGLKTVPLGGILAVTSSDQGSAMDIPLWVEKARHELIDVRAESKATRFVVRKLH